MRFELHCHSCHSRGSKIPFEGIPSPEDIVRHAKALGLDGVAITDHLTTKAWDAARKEAKRQGIIFIPGVELQTREGHLIALGISEPVANFLGVEETVEKIHEACGIAIAPHPFDIRGEGLKRLAFRADAVEIFNALNIDMINNRFTASLFRKTDAGMVVGSDSHTLATLGLCVNIMDAHDVPSLLRCIKKRQVRFETRYTPMGEIIVWTRYRLENSKEDVYAYISEHYGWPKTWLYSKMLKKFLATSDAPWRALAEMSLGAVRGYGILKMTTY